MASRSRLVALLAVCVAVIAGTLATPVVFDPTSVDAQTTTTSTSSTTSTTIPSDLDPTCTPEAPCSLLGNYWWPNTGFATSTTECFDDLPGNVPPTPPWLMGSGRWQCRPDYSWHGSEYRNDSTIKFTFTQVKMFNPGNLSNVIWVYKKGVGASWPATTDVTADLFRVATANCLGSGNYEKPVESICSLDTPVTVEPGEDYIILWQRTGALAHGGSNKSQSEVAWKLNMGQTYKAARRQAVDRWFPSNIGTTDHYAIGPIGYWGEFREPEGPPETTTTTRHPHSTIPINPPPEEHLASFCTFAIWDWTTQSFLGGADPETISEWQFWHDALCYLDQILYATQGTWAALERFGWQMLDLTIYGQVLDLLGVQALSESIWLSALDTAASVDNVAIQVASVVAQLGPTGPLVAAVNASGSSIVDAINGLELSVELPDTSDGFWGPLFSFLSTVVETFGELAGTLVTAIVDGFVALVDQLRDMVEALMIPSSDSVEDLAESVQDVSIVEAGTELALMPGEAVAAAQGGSASCSAEMSVNGETFDLCDSVSATMAHSAWAPIRALALGAIVIGALLILYRRVQHHMEN